MLVFLLCRNILNHDAISLRNSGFHRRLTRSTFANVSTYFSSHGERIILARLLTQIMIAHMPIDRRPSRIASKNSQCDDFQCQSMTAMLNFCPYSMFPGSVTKKTTKKWSNCTMIDFEFSRAQIHIAMDMT